MQFSAFAAIVISVLLSIFLAKKGQAYFDEWTLPGQILGLIWGFYWFRGEPLPKLLLATCGAEVFGTGLCTFTSFITDGEPLTASAFTLFVTPYLQMYVQPVSLMFTNLTNFIDEIACFGLTVALPWNGWLWWSRRARA